MKTRLTSVKARRWTRPDKDPGKDIIQQGLDAAPSDDVWWVLYAKSFEFLTVDGDVYLLQIFLCDHFYFLKMSIFILVIFQIS